MGDRVEVLLERIERLERANRVHRRLVSGASLVLLMAAGCAMTTNKEASIHSVIRANRIEVVNRQGQLGFYADATASGPVMCITNFVGEPCVVAAGSTDGGNIALLRRGGIVLNTFADEAGGQLRISDTNSKDVLAAGAAAESAFLTLERDGKMAVVAGVKDGNGYVIASSRDGDTEGLNPAPVGVQR